MINDRMKYVVPVGYHNSKNYIQRVIFKKDITNENNYSLRYNREFMNEAMLLFKKIGEKNRFKIFARIRYHYDLGEGFIETRPSSLPLVEK